MDSPLTVNETDVRDIVRLLGDVAVLEGTLNEKRFALMTGLCSLIGADAWAWSIAAETRPGAHPAFSICLMDGIPENKFGSLLKAVEHPEMADLQIPFMSEFAKSGPQFTRIRHQFVDEARFRDCGALELWHQAGIDSLILSARHTRCGSVTAIGIYREVGRPAFSERESRIAHIVLSEVDWLHEDVMPNHPDEGVASLSPRLRQVLNFLLTGKTRKEIATELDLSIHTLGDYIKEIYQRFGVRSHPELLRRFFEGDGGDAPTP